MESKFHFNEEFCEWQRVDRAQVYRGITIETLTVHADYDNAPRHREYRINYPNRQAGYIRINKRDGNIKTVKWLIDRNIENNSI